MFVKITESTRACLNIRYCIEETVTNMTCDYNIIHFQNCPHHVLLTTLQIYHNATLTCQLVWATIFIIDHIDRFASNE